MTATATAAPTVKDKELIPNGLLEDPIVNTVANFASLNFKDTESNKERDLNGFINTFICHLIFYAVFCISLVLYIFIDLGLGSLVKNQFIKLIEIAINTFVVKNPAFA